MLTTSLQKAINSWTAKIAECWFCFLQSECWPHHCKKLLITELLQLFNCWFCFFQSECWHYKKLLIVELLKLLAIAFFSLIQANLVAWSLWIEMESLFIRLLNIWILHLWLYSLSISLTSIELCFVFTEGKWLTWSSSTAAAS